jgi:phospholipid/cholesterol/gamma-HCH transport system ATP-binding protein
VKPEQPEPSSWSAFRAEFGDSLVFKDVSFQVNGEKSLSSGGSGCGKTLCSSILSGSTGLLQTRSGSRGGYCQAGSKLMQQVHETGAALSSRGLVQFMTLAENISCPCRNFDLSPKMIDLIVKMKLGLVNLSGYEIICPGNFRYEKQASLAGPYPWTVYPFLR